MRDAIRFNDCAIKSVGELPLSGRIMGGAPQLLYTGFNLGFKAVWGGFT